MVSLKTTLGMLTSFSSRSRSSTQICLVLISVKYSRSFLPEIHIALEAVLLKFHAKLAPGWALTQVNVDPIQEIGPKVGGGDSFVSGPFFARLQ